MPHTFYYKWLLSLLLAMCTLSATAQVYINELMASNDTTYRDLAGRSPDWVELYNSTDTEIDLTGWYLSDDPAEYDKWEIPDGVVLPPRGYLMILASDEDRYESGELHTNFRLSAGGETLLLTADDQEPVDEVQFGAQTTDVSYGRLHDGHPEWVYFTTPSPGRSNSTVVGVPSVSILPILSHESGLYREAIQLSISGVPDTMAVYYTLDGSDPTPEQGLLYATPLLLSLDNVRPAAQAYIPTTRGWKIPDGKVATYHTLRAQAYYGEQPVGGDVTATYFIGEMPYSMPIVNVVTDKRHLFSQQTGIYVKGDYDNYDRRGRAWERPAHIALFDREGRLEWSQQVGIRIVGNATRAFVQKSLRLYPREEYSGDDRFRHPFFGRERDSVFQRLTLRTIQGDLAGSYLRDDLVMEIARSTDSLQVDYVLRRYVIVLINGEYWGIHSLREAADEHFVEQYYEVSEDDIDFIKNRGLVEKGDSLSYLDLVHFYKTTDFSEPDAYAHIAARVDVQSFIDYTLFNIIFANADWPGNNVKQWRPRASGGRWQYILSDLDVALLNYNHDNLRWYIDPERERYNVPEWGFEMLSRFLYNPQFRAEFKQRALALLSGGLSPGHTLPTLDRLTDALTPEAAEHQRRWRFPNTLGAWEREIDFVRHFLVHRPLYVEHELSTYFGEPIRVYPNPLPSGITLSVVSDRAWSDDVSFALYSLQGELVVQAPLQGDHPEAGMPRQIVFDTPLVPGIYIARVSNGGYIGTQKLVVR